MMTSQRLVRVFKGLALLGGLLLLVALLGALVYAWRATPAQQGSHPGLRLQAEVRIERDAYGIPTIAAGSLSDLAYATGFTHAQDRGWQLEQQRRVVHGRLAELLGPGALEADRFLRVLGPRRSAAAQWQWLQAQPDKAAVVALLKAYADGVNAGWRAQARPPEMLLLGAQFETWTPEDTLGWALMMAWDLSTNWQSELLRLRLALKLPQPLAQRQAAVHTLMPPYPGDSAPPMADAPTLYAALGLGNAATQAQLAGLHAAAWPSGIEGSGSNNWVVAGSRSVSGQPLLANDPHLGLRSPAVWYLMRMRLPGLQAAGATLPGLPGLLLGQNEHLAWAFTNTGPDTQDLYLEELRSGPDGRTEARTPGGWEPLRTHTETLRVKGAEAHTLTVRSSRHGPLISDAGPGQDLLGAGGRRFALALRWQAQDTDIDVSSSFIGMLRARSWPEFRDAVRAYATPMQTMLVAERGAAGGGIHLIAPGRVPVRGAQHDLQGLTPAPGWDARYDWQGSIAFEQLPQRSNPPQGWLASANQKIVESQAHAQLSHEWAAPWRQQRIEALLAEQPLHSVDSFLRLQADQRSLAVAPLLAAFRAARSQHPLAATLDAERQAFSGQMDADAAAPALFWAWTRQLTEALLSGSVGEELAQRALTTRNFRDALPLLLADPASPWCDDRRTPAVERCAGQVDAALDRAFAELQTLLGPDPQRWRWGQLHAVHAEHTPFSRVSLLRPLFELSAPKGGDTYTVDAARVRLRPDAAGRLYGNDHGPSLRAVYELADPRRSRFIISSGQSGLPWRAQYRDQFALWLRHDTLPLWPAEAPAHTLTLRP